MKGKKYFLLILAAAAFLRLFRLGQVPISMFGDELDVGYHAYSILKTGRDYYGNFLPLHFHSLAEWRTPLYLYSAVPTVGIWGITALGVRLPAALFGIAGVWALFLLVRQLTKNEKLALLSAAVLAFSPWHIQYSRAAFEVTLLLLFLLMGLYLFFKSINDAKWLPVSAAFLAFTPWIYSTAKLFTPLLLIFLLLVWGKEILSLSKKHLTVAAVALLIIGAPIAYSTVFGGGAQRFGYVSVFTNPVTETEVGVARQNDARFRGEMGVGLTPTLKDRVIHNKYTFWGKNILKNYFEPFSTDFLFIKGDLNLRHSIENVGQFYVVEAAALILGIIFFFTSKLSKKIKWFIIFWLLAGVIPASITRDGGKHATRLILILPALVILIASGLLGGKNLVGKKYRKYLIAAFGMVFAVNFIFYQFTYWNHNPWYSERWWHSGWKEAVSSIKEIEDNYDRVVITMADEPPWIFFAGHYQYDPEAWQAGIPTENWSDMEGYGRVTTIEKYVFGTPSAPNIYEYGKIIDSNTLYLASQKEVEIDLVKEPERTPGNLELLKSITYPSGAPAFYLFTGKANE